jgi:hypothetical protein
MATTIREAAHSLCDHFRCGDGMHPYITSIGEGADTIHVYLVRKVRGHEQPVPSEWEGWPVVTRVVGRMRLN